MATLNFATRPSKAKAAIWNKILVVGNSMMNNIDERKLATSNCCTGKEDNEHFLLHCKQFDLKCVDPFGQFSEIPFFDVNDMKTIALCNLLLYDSSHLIIIINGMILDATTSFIKAAQCFQ